MRKYSLVKAKCGKKSFVDLSATGKSAVKNIENAMSINRANPDFHFSLAQCYIQLDRIKDAVIHFTQFIKARPRNIKGWRELIRCLYDAGMDYLS